MAFHQANRISGFDFARALSVAGMVIVNYTIVLASERSSPTWLSWLVHALEGRAAATFVILAGIGIALLAKKATEEQHVESIRATRISLLVRTILLFAIGLAYTSIWPADILHFYGLYICIGIVFLTARSTTILAMAAVSTAVFPLLLVLFDYTTGWNWQTLTYVDFWTVSGMARHLFFNGFHPVFPWVAFLLLGMVLGRLNWQDAALRKKLLLLGLAVLALSEMLSFALSSLIHTTARGANAADLLALVTTKPMPPMPLYILSASASSLLVLLGSVFIAERYAENVVVRTLVQTGSMALTLYVAHVVLGMGLLEAMDSLHNNTLSFAVLYSCGFFLTCIAFSALWLRYFQRGPLEHLLRAISTRATQMLQ